MSDVQIHWFSIINSVVVVFFLAGFYLTDVSVLFSAFNFALLFCCFLYAKGMWSLKMWRKILA